MKEKKASISLQEVNVEFPVFHAATLSLKNRILNSITGGVLSRDQEGHVIVQSLHQINLDISSGERIGIIGHNGAGKTTLLRVLSGIYHPSRGKVSINGECVSLINITLGIDPEANGYENIRLRSVMMGQAPDILAERIDDIVEFSGLGDFLHLPFRTYSSGMKMRLAFAVSTFIQPQILIMDEWLSLGDADFAERAKKRMEELLKDTEILILASHSKPLILQHCNRVIWLEHGKVKMDGPAEEVTDAYFKKS